jgi:hypothetical protein
VPFFERTEELKKIAEPMLVVIGDEDDSTHGLAVRQENATSSAAP